MVSQLNVRSSIQNLSRSRCDSLPGLDSSGWTSDPWSVSSAKLLWVCLYDPNNLWLVCQTALCRCSVGDPLLQGHSQSLLRCADSNLPHSITHQTKSPLDTETRGVARREGGKPESVRVWVTKICCKDGRKDEWKRQEKERRGQREARETTSRNEKVGWEDSEKSNRCEFVWTKGSSCARKREGFTEPPRSEAEWFL